MKTSKNTVVTLVMLFFASLVVSSAFVLLLTGSASKENLSSYLFFYLLEFWKDNGFELAFAYVALCTVLPGITLKEKNHDFYYNYKIGIIIAVTGFYLLLSLLATLLAPALVNMKEIFFCSILSHSLQIVLFLLGDLLLDLAFFYIAVFVFTLITIFGYMKG